MATMTIAILLPVVVAAGLWSRSFIGERLAGPPEGPDYSAARMCEHRGAWEEALGEWTAVREAFPLDATPLWKIADIHRHRLDRPEEYENTLREIVCMPDGAGPDWILHEARVALDRVDLPEMTVKRPTEIEL